MSYTKVVFFCVDRKTKVAALASDWPRHFRLLLCNRWIEFIETWHEGRPQHPLPDLCFRADRRNKNGCTGLWLAETFSPSFLQPLRFKKTWQEGSIQHPLPSMCFFRTTGKPGLLPWPLVGWDILDFFFATTEWNATTLDRKQYLNILYQVLFFWTIQRTNMATPESDWLRHCQLFLYNHLTVFNEGWQETRF